ncbi:hypothetical protein BV25DRAFT_1828060 [Artomyces pyxidatus]|uniref:Uncharacterized protein n=1 Tax=Artomyces pyxidatus TaxID=48021 RepID=A0ACB8SX18_9AGAM|nr:hypothetical protein BV25DRAFT_1828060 [Artomyces pyxidatus]
MAGRDLARTGGRGRWPFVLVFTSHTDVEPEQERTWPVDTGRLRRRLSAAADVEGLQSRRRRVSGGVAMMYVCICCYAVPSLCSTPRAASGVRQATGKRGSAECLLAGEYVGQAHSEEPCTQIEHSAARDAQSR